MSEDEDRTGDKGTRGIVEFCQAYSNDGHRSILPGENTTYNITFQPTLYEGTADVYPQMKDVPPNVVVQGNPARVIQHLDT